MFSVPNQSSHWLYTATTGTGAFASIIIVFLLIIKRLKSPEVRNMPRNKKLSKTVGEKRKSDRQAKTSAMRNLVDLSDSDIDINTSTPDKQAVNGSTYRKAVATVAKESERIVLESGNVPISKETHPLPKENPLYCLETCLHKGLRSNSSMIRCCQCMLWVHPECCGDKDDDLDDIIVYNCSQCRNILSRWSRWKSRLKVSTVLIKT